MKDRQADQHTTPPAPTTLRAVAVTKRFGGAVALNAVSLSVPTGEISGLIGPNGAGKTTLFDILAGEQRPTSGHVFLRDRAVESAPTHERLSAGLGRTFQIPRPFAAMTVLENVMLGQQNHIGEHVWPNWLAFARVARIEAAVLERAMELLEFVALAPLAHKPA
jgi:branched-chain amino acid transport system ATP-binding protein